MFSFLLRFVHFPVNIAAGQQFLVFAGGYDLTLIQHDDLIGVLYRADPLCNNDFGGIGYIICKGILDTRIGFGIYGAGGIVEDQYLGLL